jgi:Ca-activated chloride channel homolog
MFVYLVVIATYSIKKLLVTISVISFAHPVYLALLPLAIILPWLWHRSPKPSLRFSDLSLFRKIGHRRGPFWEKCRIAIRSLILVSLILAIAGIRIPDSRTRMTIEGIQIILAIDVSGSMGENDFPWSENEPAQSRLNAAKRAFRLLIAGGDGPQGITFTGRKQDQIGIVSFAAWPESVCPLTMNRTVLLNVLDQLQPKTGPDAGTNIGDGIAESLIRLNSNRLTRKVLVLLSDGEHNISLTRDDPPLKPRQAAQLAVDLGVTIYSVDCGGVRKDDPEELKKRADGQATMEAIARMTGGKSFEANNAIELQETLKEIDQLERQTEESFLYQKYFDLSPWLGLSAFAGLLLIALLEKTVLRVYPE